MTNADICILGQCYHTRDKYWFLPKGRRNANETTSGAAEREGFEESGYRNRLLPLPMRHRQPDPDEGHLNYVTEPLWTQLLPLTSTSQYMLFWYAAETVTSEIEEAYGSAESGGPTGVAARIYQPPPRFPNDMTLKQRIVKDTAIAGDGKQKLYEPVWHPGTGVDEEEKLYRSSLLTIPEARRKLRGSVLEDVVRRGWEAIQLRMEMEEKEAVSSETNQRT